MPKPFIAIIGRPNVGKSTLFNRLTCSHSAIVEDQPGVTRDRLYREASYDGEEFIVVDTGGLLVGTKDEMLLQVIKQSLFAVEEADIIITLFDGKEGVTETDREIVKLLRPIKKSIFYVVNKIDAHSRLDRLYDFYSLGVKELIPLSAETGHGFSEFIEKVLEKIPEKDFYGADAGELPKIAIVGKPNVGKSTVVNSLLGKERMIISPVPGTTRDSIDSLCRYYRRKYIIIDTAGLRHKSKVFLPLEQHMTLRAVRSIDRADVVLHIIDATDGVSEQDKKIAGLIERYGKGVVIIFNKWDLIEEPEMRYKAFMKEVEWKLYFLNYAPVLTISGLTKNRITKVFPIIDEVLKERKRRIPTSELNRLVSEIERFLPSFRGKKTKILYMTQTDVTPPSFVLFVNYPQSFRPEHTKYIERIIREKYHFKGTPIRVYIRKKR